MDTKNRIQIDGVWYVREDTLKSKDVNFEVYEDDHIPTRGITLELEDFCFEFSVLESIDEEDGSSFEMPSIVFYDKNTDITHEGWDNEIWMFDIIDETPGAMHEFPNGFTPTQIIGLKSIINKAESLGYIKRK